MEVRRDGGEDATSRFVEALSWSPRAFLYHGFMSEEEADHIRAVAEPTMQRSKVVDAQNGGETTDPIRTSSGTFIPRGYDEVQRRVERRVAEWAQVPVEHQEDLQVLRYHLGEKYADHYDWFAGAGGFDEQKSNQRVATALLYLADVDEGGETVFPKAKANGKKALRGESDALSACARRGVAVRAKKGDAILFFDMNLLGDVENASLHASCPVIAGVKWTATKWMHVKPFAVAEVDTSERVCADVEKGCEGWARQGECAANPKFMLGETFAPWGQRGKCVKACCELAGECVKACERER